MAAPDEDFGELALPWLASFRMSTKRQTRRTYETRKPIATDQSGTHPRSRLRG